MSDAAASTVGRKPADALDEDDCVFVLELPLPHPTTNAHAAIAAAAMAVARARGALRNCDSSLVGASI
ncbi:MAG TPA: hypothetical protein VFB39_06015 [Solirubrobacteraceae bacterium]|nr:hypothetical protein [Solirubrobacteraceae bacterium]